MTISCVDLFCGVGGLTYGIEKEGIEVRAGIDIDPVCKFPYEKNTKAKYVEKNIKDVSISELNKLFGSDTSYKVLAGCAPCQPFSTYRQGMDSKSDHKWGLLYEFSRLAKGSRPDIVTMENVSTVSKHTVFHDFVGSLKVLGYHVWYDVVDCTLYGAPQTRKRMVLLASLHDDIKIIAPTRNKPKTVKQTIGNLEPLKAGENSLKDPLHISASLSAKNMKRMKASKPGGTWRDWPEDLIVDCHKQESGKSYPSVYGRMEWDKPAPTMTTQCYGYGNGRFGHPEQDRAISLREAAMIQGFPKSYQFVPKNTPIMMTHIGRMIGNAVPVHLGRAVGRSIVEHIKYLEY